MPADAYVLKILRRDETLHFLSQRAFDGSPDDREDGFIHLSTHAQLDGTLAKHFSGETGLFLAIFAAETLSELRWEPSRAGALFPHCYAPLLLNTVVALVPIPDARAGWLPPVITSSG